MKVQSTAELPGRFPFSRDTLVIFIALHNGREFASLSGGVERLSEGDGWLAVESDGSAWLFKKRPTVVRGLWRRKAPDDTWLYKVAVFPKNSPLTQDWQNSLFKVLL